MQDRLNDTLVVLNHEAQGSAGCTEICRAEDGQKWVRISIAKTELQKRILLQLDPSIPACLSEEQFDLRKRVRLQSKEDVPVYFPETHLNLLFPFQKGQDLDDWLFYEHPTVEKRKEMCMSLLEQLLTQPIPEEIIALSARTENLCFQNNDKLVLQLLPDLKSWEHELSSSDVVNRIAKQMAEVLTRDLDMRIDQVYPVELRLFLMRSQSEGYNNWGQLQEDLFRIPDTLDSKVQKLHSFKNRAQEKIKLWAPIGLRIVTFILAVLAIVSVSFKAFEWYTNRNTPEQETTVETGTQGLGEENK